MRPKNGRGPGKSANTRTAFSIDGGRYSSKVMSRGGRILDEKKRLSNEKMNIFSRGEQRIWTPRW